MMNMILESGQVYTPRDTDIVKCEVHNVIIYWGDLDNIQQLVFSEGLDTTIDLPCILAPGRYRYW